MEIGTILIQGMAQATKDMIKRKILEGLCYGSAVAFSQVLVSEAVRGVLKKEKEMIKKRKEFKEKCEEITLDE